MNKSAIQKFAMWARTTLMEQVRQRAFQYGITKDGYGEENAVTVNGMALSPQEQSQRRELVREIQAKGYDQVVEEVAYTWFNRFIALRYMEVNNYLPSHIRVFSNAQGAFDPEILKEALHIDLPGLDQSKVAEYIEKNETEALYRYLLLTQCNALNEGLPKMFEKMGGYTELLFPNNMLRPDSVLDRMVADIPEEDWTDQVQIIGWMYQYYNTELKDETFDLLKKNVKVTKERIPSATQLFTPDWIVRYMVENSLGRLWLEGHPNPALRENWKYYLDEAEQEPEVEAQLVVLRAQRQTLRPEDITLIDPCMGSGHILVYAFDVLMQIYESEGWSQRDAAASIVQKNLYGLDIDRRAAQLAYFAVMMKARQYDRRFLTRGIQPNLYHPGTYAEGQEFGSLLIVDELEPKPEQPDELTLFDGNYGDKLNTWNFRSLLARQYDVVVTNPPYMRNRGMSAKLTKYAKKCYEPYKFDLYAMFIARCQKFMKKSGYMSMITQHSFMFLSRFEQIRNDFAQKQISSMVHLGTKAFEEIGGEVVQTVAFTIGNFHVRDHIGRYKRLVQYEDAHLKEINFFDEKNDYFSKQEQFHIIPGGVIAYWVSNNVIRAFEKGTLLGDISYPRKGNSTSDNDRFLRFWWEVETSHLNIGAKEIVLSETLIKRWYPYNKGGSYRKWYGNNEYVVDWKNDAAEMRAIPSAVIANYQFFMTPGMTWSTISGGNIGVRRFENGFIFDNKGECLFADKYEDLDYYAAFLNSNTVMKFLSFLSPTLDFNCGYIAKLPVINMDDMIKETVRTFTRDNTQLSHEDWDSFETSWDFKRHPLV